MSNYDIGLIGLAVMGENLILNMERNGFSVAVFNRTVSKVDRFIEGRAKGKNIKGCHSIEELAANLKRPRRIMLMVKAGKAVDDFIEMILPYLEKGDIVIDGETVIFRTPFEEPNTWKKRDSFSSVPEFPEAKKVHSMDPQSCLVVRRMHGSILNRFSRLSLPKPPTVIPAAIGLVRMVPAIL